MEKEHELICIVCPMGCHLKVTKTDQGTIVVKGNTCKRGEQYGKNELTNPVRVLTTTVKIMGGSLHSLPVKTNQPIPKGLIFEAMKEINKVVVEAPVTVRDVIIKNILGTGADVVASRSMKK
ncbi:DUF1667 domain-containing protein [Anaeromicropila populeti]|uniref:CxxC motif-containing protein n=1 Tax=Anaeromicropila populeti TaxID=37658 RepID=A0A1I6I6Q6_9FIRM|nr:DUF1667 domain-containing protein [Anaeromicropila populeti]SFR62344.1 CxxC motif-containing protein [Anaeromicropila populeti]